MARVGRQIAGQAGFPMLRQTLVVAPVSQAEQCLLGFRRRDACFEKHQLQCFDLKTARSNSSACGR
jgi:hypothetical protein